MDYTNLSKTVSHALRRLPEAYGLQPDAEGWVRVSCLLDALRQQSCEWMSLTESDLYEMIRLSAKQRYEIRKGRIRALYGHSAARRILKRPKRPPVLLYHGTAASAAAIILGEGLKPMDRQYVHLSLDPDIAFEVGKRKEARPAILIVYAGDAWKAGVAFYEGNRTVWLADYVPAKFISSAVTPVAS